MGLYFQVSDNMVLVFEFAFSTFFLYVRTIYRYLHLLMQFWHRPKAIETRL